MFEIFKRKPRPNAATPLLQVDEWGVRRNLNSGETEAMSWVELQSVVVATTDGGPLEDDVFILLIDSNGRTCAIPQTSESSTLLLKWLQRLPGFDNEQYIAAMSSVDNAQFVCWQRPSTAEH